MAEKVGVVYIEIQAKMGRLEADLKSLEERLSKTNNSGLALGEQFRRITQSSALFGTKTDELSEKNKVLRSRMEDLIAKGVDPTNKGFAKLKTQFDDNKKELDEISKYTTKTTSSFSALGGYLAGGAIAAGLIGIGKAALEASANMEQTKVAFKTMLGSEAIADSLLKKMQEFAAVTPFQFSDIADAGRRMLAFGFTADEVIPKLRQIGDISAGLSQPIGDIVYLYGQIKTQGKAMSQDLMQFANRGIPIYEELAKVLGVSTSQVKDLTEKGKIGFKEIEKVFTNLTKEGSKFGGLMDAQSKTLGGQWSNFKDNLERIAVIMGDGLAPGAKQALSAVNNLLESDTAGFQRQIGEAAEKMKKYIALKGESADISKDTESWDAYDIKMIEKKLGIQVPLNASSKERLAIYEKIAKIGQVEAENLELVKNNAGEITKVSNKAVADLAKMADGFSKQYDAKHKTNSLTADEIKKYEQLKKKVEDLTASIREQYAAATGNTDMQTDNDIAKLLKQRKELSDNYAKDSKANYWQYRESLNQIDAVITQKESQRFNRALEEKMTKYAQFSGGFLQLSSQLSQLVTMNASNQTTTIDNRLKKELDAIQERYEAEVEAIKNSTMSEEEKNAKLKALDEQKARDEEALQKEAERKKRKIAREAAKAQKKIALFETMLAIPTAAFQSYKALAEIPVVGPALGIAAAAAATAMGLAKLKLIQDQPLPELAEGGIIPAVNGGRVVRVAEAGSTEGVIPFDNRGIDILSQAMAKAGNNQPIIIENVINIDGEQFGKWIYRGTARGNILISSRGLVE